MAIKTSELTQRIAEQVTKDVARKLIPKFRKIVREEVDRGMKDLLYEMVIKQRMPLRGNDFIEKNTVQFTEEDRPENVSTAKNFVAQRQASRARAQSILEGKFQTNDPYASLIMDVEDPQEDEVMKQEHIMGQPMVKSKEVAKGDTIMPENIDFSEHMDKLLPQ